MKSTYENRKLIALAGNPNVGKSTIFNALTGAKQHTGNWTGKTVETARRPARIADLSADVVDLPGTMTLQGGSDEENVARDVITGGKADVIVLVADACALERNLILLLQILQFSDQVVLCLNLADEAEKKGIRIDCEKLSSILHIPVIATDAHKKRSILALAELIGRQLKTQGGAQGAQDIGHKAQGTGEGQEPVRSDYCGNCALCTASCRLDEYVRRAEEIVPLVTTRRRADPFRRDRKLDRILTSKVFGVPILLLFMGALLWITIAGANYPSQGLAYLFSKLERWLYGLFGARPVFADILIGGMFHTVAVVVSVMLPPMAIFFPLFALLEEFGYLPRMAFLLDRSFQRSGTSGKQALCMCMGVGCNAAGVMGCRIINGEKQRIAAVVTNSFMPCNGRFPLLVTLSALFFSASALAGAGTVLAAITLGVLFTLLANRLLTATMLKEKRPHFSLELPPYRRPRVFKTVGHALYGKALKLLIRAIVFSAPFSAIIILGGYFQVGGDSILNHAGNFLNPAGRLLGVDGFVLLAFILALPANEIFLPVLLMSYTSSGALTELSMPALQALLTANGWTALTAINVMILCLLHFPCATTLITIKKETNLKWTLVAFFLPLIFGIILCLITTGISKLF